MRSLDATRFGPSMQSKAPRRPEPADFGITLGDIARFEAREKKIERVEPMVAFGGSAVAWLIYGLSSGDAAALIRGGALGLGFLAFLYLGCTLMTAMVGILVASPLV